MTTATSSGQAFAVAQRVRLFAPISESIPTGTGYGRAVPHARLFDEQTGFPPPGRIRLTWEEAVEHLVTSFAESNTRTEIWNGFERYLARFIDVEDLRQTELSGKPLVLAVWIGGSFVSSATDPNNIDISVMVDAEARDLIKGKPGSKWLTEAFNRKSCLAQYRVSPLALYYRPIPSIIRHEILPTPEKEYLRARGAWDDWWQRCRDPLASDGRPSLQTVHPARGYVEVAL